MDGFKIEWIDDDHVWINGKQFISLRRTGEMIRERLEAQNRGREIPAAIDFPIERYKLTFRHDLVDHIREYEIDPPYIVEYSARRDQIGSGPDLINAILEKMRSEVLKKYAKETEP